MLPLEGRWGSFQDNPHTLAFTRLRMVLSNSLVPPMSLVTLHTNGPHLIALQGFGTFQGPLLQSICHATWIQGTTLVVSKNEITFQHWWTTLGIWSAKIRCVTLRDNPMVDGWDTSQTWQHFQHIQNFYQYHMLPQQKPTRPNNAYKNQHPWIS